jgi:hypothetical protein
MAVNKSPTLKSWYKYDDNMVNLVKFVKGNTNSVLMDSQETTSILFYVDVRHVFVCLNNPCNDDEVIDITGHEHPPVINQLQDATSSSSSSNTLSLLLSYTSSPSSSNNSSRSLTSVRPKTNLDNNSLFRSSSQSTTMARATQVKLNLPIIFFLLQLGYGFNVRRYLQYPTSKTVCRKNVGWKYVKKVALCTWRMRCESAQILSNRLVTLTWFRGES